MRIIARSQLLSLFTFLIIFITFSIMLYGCASTTPNISIVDENFRFDCEANDNLHKVKDILAEISLKNKLLSIELGKLPEFQDCIIIKEKLGLDNIYNFYNDNCSILDEAFAKMYEVGKPETRRYCTPLQALQNFGNAEALIKKGHKNMDRIAAQSERTI